MSATVLITKNGRKGRFATKPARELLAPTISCASSSGFQSPRPCARQQVCSRPCSSNWRYRAMGLPNDVDTSARHPSRTASRSPRAKKTDPTDRHLAGGGNSMQCDCQGRTTTRRAGAIANIDRERRCAVSQKKMHARRHAFTATGMPIFLSMVSTV